MSANKSIIEEALLEAKQIEEAVKTNTKEILAKTMMPEIEEMVKESLTEDDLSETGEGQVTEDEESVTVDAQIDDEESDYEGDDEDDEEEVAIVAVSDEDDDEEGEEASAEIEMGGEVEIPSIVDLTSSSDDEVIKVFKELSDDDEVEVVGDVVKIKATEPTEYRVEVPGVEVEAAIDEGGESEGEQEASHPDYPNYKGTDKEYDEKDSKDSGARHGDQRKSPGDYMEEDEAIYEIELSEDDLNEIESAIDEGGESEGEQEASHPDYPNYKGTKQDKEYDEKDSKDSGARHGDQRKSPGDYMEEKYGAEAGDERKGDIDYADAKDGDKETGSGASAGDQGKKRRAYKTKKGRDNEGGNKGDKKKTGKGRDYENESEEDLEETSRLKAGPNSSFSRMAGQGIWGKDKVNEAVQAELENLRSKNGEYKEALKVFRNKLNEIAVFNSNLAYATKLFMEHSTTKTEKMEILKRFDNVSTLKESKSLFRSIEGEMGTKAPVTESIEKTIKAPTAGALIKEDTAYVDPQVARMKFLMEKLG